MASDLQQNTERVTSLFARVMMRSMTLRALAEAGSRDLSLSQLQCLRYLARHRKCRLGQISEGLSITSPGATKLIDRLVKKGLVSNSQCASDRRSAEIDLTDEGRRLVESFRAGRLRRLDAILARMAPEERAALELGLEGFVLAALEDEAGMRAACLRCGDEHDPDCLVNQAHVAATGRPMGL